MFLRTLGVSKDQSNSVLKREISSFRNSEKNMEVQGLTASKIVHPIVNVERKTLLNASLKRKTFEVSFFPFIQKTVYCVKLTKNFYHFLILKQ